jgi:hypothetical protein
MAASIVMQLCHEVKQGIRVWLVLHPCGGKRENQGKPMPYQGKVILWSSAELPIKGCRPLCVETRQILQNKRKTIAG